jgi:hypothetical protein
MVSAVYPLEDAIRHGGPMSWKVRLAWRRCLDALRRILRGRGSGDVRVEARRLVRADGGKTNPRGQREPAYAFCIVRTHGAEGVHQLGAGDARHQLHGKGAVIPRAARTRIAAFPVKAGGNR